LLHLDIRKNIANAHYVCKPDFFVEEPKKK